MKHGMRSWFPAGSRRCAFNTRLQWQRRLGWEPREFRRGWDALKTIEGWRYRQDLVLLYLLARDLSGPGVTLEIGSYKGLGTAVLAFGARDGGHEKVHTVDPHTGDRQALETAGVERLPSQEDFHRNIAAAGIADIVVAYTMTSDELAARWMGTTIRFLFVDGWHSYDAVRSDLRNWVPLVTACGGVLVDDYANYPEVAQAVDDSGDALPPRRVRAGRMHLSSNGPLPPAVQRFLRLPWG
jgi:predicted O-methyltransferase YrrM